MSIASRPKGARSTGAQSLEILAQLTRTVARDRRWRELVRTDDGERWHQLLHRGDDLEVWLLGWGDGCGVELHDHGGASSAYRVVEGTLLETWTSLRSAGQMRRLRLPSGATRRMSPDIVHEVSATGPSQALSIHCYSPPLSSMTFYKRRPGQGLVACRIEEADRSEAPAWSGLLRRP